jgi:hypothetical protein
MVSAMGSLLAMCLEKRVRNREEIGKVFPNILSEETLTETGLAYHGTLT